MAFENRKWVIVKTEDLSDEMIEPCLQSSQDTVRKSIDGSKCLLKWEGNTPSIFSEETIYTHSEILEVLSGSEWTESEGE